MARLPGRVPNPARGIDMRRGVTLVLFSLPQRSTSHVGRSRHIAFALCGAVRGADGFEARVVPAAMPAHASCAVHFGRRPAHDARLLCARRPRPAACHAQAELPPRDREVREVDTDPRFTYCAVAVCAMLGDFSGINIATATAFLRGCQRYDGGFGASGTQEAHAGMTYCCVAALHLLSRVEQGATWPSDQAVAWLAHRQVNATPRRMREARWPAEQGSAGRVLLVLERRCAVVAFGARACRRPRRRWIRAVSPEPCGWCFKNPRRPSGSAAHLPRARLALAPPARPRRRRHGRAPARLWARAARCRTQLHTRGQAVDRYASEQEQDVIDCVSKRLSRVSAVGGSVGRAEEQSIAATQIGIERGESARFRSRQAWQSVRACGRGCGFDQ
ncbi:hypothetical protein L1887_48234 [Cichorium endivia]|nr:hypothetical protein L1887_48234 [Cichorium endivia]